MTTRRIDSENPYSGTYIRSNDNTSGNMYSRMYSTRRQSSYQPNMLLVRLVICLALVGVTVGIKAWFPKAAEVASDAVLGDGGYAEVFSNFGESVSDGDGIKNAFLDMVEQLVAVGRRP